MTEKARLQIICPECDGWDAALIACPHGCGVRMVVEEKARPLLDTTCDTCEGTGMEHMGAYSYAGGKLYDGGTTCADCGGSGNAAPSEERP